MALLAAMRNKRVLAVLTPMAILVAVPTIISRVALQTESTVHGQADIFLCESEPCASSDAGTLRGEIILDHVPATQGVPVSGYYLVPPALFSNIPVPGTVDVQHGGQTVVAQEVRLNRWVFTIALPAGVYEATATVSPSFFLSGVCRPINLTIHSGETVFIKVACFSQS